MLALNELDYGQECHDDDFTWIAFWQSSKKYHDFF